MLKKSVVVAKIGIMSIELDQVTTDTISDR